MNNMEKIKNLWNSFVTSLKEDKKFRIRAIIIASAVLVVIAAIVIVCVCAGGNDNMDNPPETTGSTENSAPEGQLNYSVTVTDAQGNPVSGVIVQFVSNGTVAGMQQTNEQGVAEKVLAEGEYTIELGFTGTSAVYTYDAAAAVVNADSSAVTIVLYSALGEETKDLSAYSAAIDGQKDYTAYYIFEGSTIIPLDTEDRSYFIFVPTRDGVYRFSVDNPSVEIGYYGSTYFVQSSNLAEMTDEGTFTVDIAPSMINLEDNTGTASLVIGVDSGDASRCVFTIERIGDHVMTIEEYPWDIYETTADLSKFELPEGINLIDFDLTASTDAYNLVFNENDGFYHMDTEDGPLVYVKLGVDSAYLDSLQKVVESSSVVRYFFDENGEFRSKESYTECLTEYIEYMDEDCGVYPLTEDLKYILQQRGEYVGWWDPDSMTFIFVDDNGNPVIGLNKEIAWLFACCYGEEVQQDTEPTEPAPTEPTPTEPVPTEPAPTEPNPTEPQPTEPAPTEPRPTEPSFQLGKESDAATVELKYYQIADSMSFEATVKAGEYVRYDLYQMFDMIITIESEDAYIVFGEGKNQKIYRPENGVVTFVLEFASNDVSAPCSFGIGNSGSGKATFKVKLSVIPGTQNNPVKLKLGDFTTYTAEGEDQGYYYTYTADKAGTLTVTFKSINIDKDCQISLYNLNTYVYMSEINSTISIDVNAGDEVQIVVVVADENYKFPAATIKATASFK